MDSLKVFIADHFFIVRQGIKAQFAAANIEIVGEAANKWQLYARLVRQERQSDVLLLEVSLPELDPVGLIHALRLKYPALKVLVFTGTFNPWRNAELFECGVDGFLSKADNADLATVVNQVARGEAYYSPRIWHWRAK